MRKFEAKTMFGLALPAIAIVSFGVFARRIASNQKHQPPFVIEKDEFYRDNADGYWSFNRLVTVRFRRNSWWEDLLAPEKSAWYRSIDEIATATNTRRKVSPSTMQSIDSETYQDDIGKPVHEYFEGFDEEPLKKIHEPILFETTISWTEGRDSAIHSATLRHLFSPEQRLKVKTFNWNPKTKKSEVQ